MAALLFLAAAFLVSQSTALSPAVSASPSQSLAPSSSSYQALVQQYLHGNPDAAVAELVRWDARRVTAVRPTLDTLIGADVKVLQAVAMLHMEAILKGAPRDVHVLPASAAYLCLTRREGVPPAFLRGWYIAMNSLLMSRGLTTSGLPAPVGPDAEVLLLEGSAVENWASVMLIADGYSPDVHRDSAGKLLEAEGKYREALAMDATLVEARLRLGRVLMLRGRLDEARMELERARNEAPAGYPRYLAALFLGEVHERAGRPQAASECYESAIREYPDSQTAYLALGHLLQLSGDQDAGWSTARKMFGEGADHRNPERDPWWVYWFGQYWQIYRRIDDLRAMVRR